MTPQRTPSGGGLVFSVILFALLFIVGPVILFVLRIQLPLESMLLLMGFGLVLLIIGMILLVVTRLYHRAPPDMAFVRTGLGGPKAIIDGGAVVVPLVHEVRWVSLSTMRIEVVREGREAVITKDNIRADITAEFYVRISKNAEAVITAATSLGMSAVNADAIKGLLEKKLESAVRSVAAQMTLTELLVNRDSFIEQISDHVTTDINSNGLLLETVTISKFDQTPRAALDAEGNLFDAQGARNIAAVTAQMNVERNEILRNSELLIKQKTVETQRALYDQDVANATAQAERDRNIQVVQANARQMAATAEAEQERLSGIAQVQRDQALQVAEVQKEQQVQVAGQARERAVRTAEIEKEQTIEVANRQKQGAIADAERVAAEAEAKRQAAEALAEKERQGVTTVQVTSKAERDKQQAVISAQAEAQKQSVSKNTEADIAAYTVTTKATAEQDAAERLARATITKAEADKQAKVLEAEGQSAIELVPVTIAMKQVEVNRAQVDVDRSKLENQSEFEGIARELQVDLAKIDADKAARIAQAEAMGAALASAQMKIFGDPAALTEVMQAFSRGQTMGSLANGLADGISPEVLAALSAGLGPIVTSMVEKILGTTKTEEAQKEVSKRAAGK